MRRWRTGASSRVALPARWMRAHGSVSLIMMPWKAARPDLKCAEFGFLLIHDLQLEARWLPPPPPAPSGARARARTDPANLEN